MAVEGFDKFKPYSQMSFAPNVPNISVGDPRIDQILSLLLSGAGLAPRPHAGQSVMEAYIQRDRSMDFLKTMRQSFGSQLAAQKLGGINTNSAFGGMLSMFLGQPDGLMNNPIMRAFNGGNPVKAAMGLQANMTGMTQYMSTGQIGNASPQNVFNTYDGLTQSLFDTKVITQKDYDKLHRQKNKETLEFINSDKRRRERFESVISKDDDGKEQVNFTQLAKIREATRTGAKKTKDMMIKASAEEMEKVFGAVEALDIKRGQKGQLTPERVNFEMTRGYEIQDLAKSYTTAIDLNMMDERSAREAAEEAGSKKPEKYSAMAYFDRAGAILRSYSDLTGVESADDAAKGINQLFTGYTDNADGTRSFSRSQLDFGSDNTDERKAQLAARGADTDTKYAEELIRTTKGVARTAGISIEAMIGIINQTKSLAARYPEMRNLGGVGAIQQSIKSFTNSQVLMATMGSHWVAREGGATEVVRKQQELDMENRAEPVTQRLYALRAMVETLPDLSDQQREEARQMIKARATGKMGTFDPSGENDFIEQLSKKVNRSVGTVLRYQDSSSLKQLGNEHGARDKELGREDLRIDETGQTSKADEYNDYLRVLIKDQIGKDKADGKPSIFKDRKGQPTTEVEEIQLKIREELFESRLPGAKRKTPTEVLMNNGGLDPRDAYRDDSDETYEKFQKSWMIQELAKTQEYQKQLATIKTVQTKYADDEAAMARDSAAIQAPMGQVLAQGLLNGELGKDYDAFMANIKDPYARSSAEKLMKGAQRMNQEHSKVSINELFTELQGGTGTDDEVRKRLRAQGYSPGEVGKIMNQRAANTESGRGAFDEAAEKGITLHQLMRATRGNTDEERRKSFESSKAKETGMSFERAREGADWAWHGGLASGDGVMQLYGNKVISQSVMEGMLNDKTMLTSGKILNKSIIEKGDKRATSNIEHILSVVESTDPERAKSLRELLDRGGYTKRDRPIAGYNTGLLKQQFEKGTVNSETREAFLKYGRDYLDFNSKGEITGMKGDLAKDLANDEADPALLERMKEDGLVMYGEGEGEYEGLDSTQIGEGYKGEGKRNVSDSLTQHLLAKGYLIEDKKTGRNALDKKKLREAVLGPDATDKDTAKQLLAEQHGEGSAGVLKSLDATKLALNLRRDEVNPQLQGTEIDKTMLDTVQLREVAKKKIEEYGGNVATGVDGAQLDVLKSIQGTLGGSGAGSFIGAMTNIATALNSLVGLSK